VIADAALLTRILTSLVADALHRSPAGAPPALTAAFDGSSVTIRVIDQGTGPVPANGNGSGLALGLAGDLAEAMGGTLRCDPTPAGDHSVAITLPAARRPLPHPVSATLA